MAAAATPSGRHELQCGRPTAERGDVAEFDGADACGADGTDEDIGDSGLTHLVGKRFLQFEEHQAWRVAVARILVYSGMPLDYARASPWCVYGGCRAAEAYRRRGELDCMHVLGWSSRMSTNYLYHG